MRESVSMAFDRGGRASPPAVPAMRAMPHREDLAIDPLIEQICATDGCTHHEAVRQILAFEEAFVEL